MSNEKTPVVVVTHHELDVWLDMAGRPLNPDNVSMALLLSDLSNCSKQQLDDLSEWIRDSQSRVLSEKNQRLIKARYRKGSSA